MSGTGFILDPVTGGAPPLDINLFADHKPALILLDLMMPVMDGFEFLRELRAKPEGREVPVVVAQNAARLTIRDAIAYE